MAQEIDKMIKELTDQLAIRLKDQLTDQLADQLKDQLKDQSNEQPLIDKINELELKLIESYDLKPVVYSGLTEKNIRKFGFTNRFKTRLAEHKAQISNNFKIDFVIETVYNREVEKDIKKKLADRIISKIYNGKVQTELIVLDENFTDKNFFDFIKKIKDSYVDKTVIVELTKELEDLMTRRNTIVENIHKNKVMIEKLKGKYKCSECNYTSEYKKDIIKHIDKKKKCSDKMPSIIELDDNITCEYCNKNLANSNSLKRHLTICEIYISNKS